MRNITVRHSYCSEHFDRYHVVDEAENCLAKDDAEMRAKGYFYVRHIGGEWYEWREPATIEPDWEAMAAAHDAAADLVYDQMEVIF
jgi:hypothetical protein